MTVPPNDRSSPRIGFGVLWNRDRSATWSHTPLSLLEGLEATGPIVDLGYDDPVRRWIHLLTHLRIRDGRPTSTWRSSPSVMDAAARSIQRRAREEGVDAVVTIGDLGTFDVPSFLVQDLSYDLLEREIAAGNRHAEGQFSRLTLQQRRENRIRQHRILESTTGVLAMSRWYAESLVADSGLDPASVHVVHPGANAAPTTVVPVDDRTPNALFVGRDFERKGGELAIAAVEVLRRGGVELGLTVIGPDAWPLAGDPPPWVDFRGPQPVPVVAEAMASHQVFVLPTRFEAFGIVYAEALLAGTPVVGPNHFAVPEIVADGDDGALFETWSVDAVAGAIGRAIAEPVRRRAFDGIAAARERWTWERAATDLRAAVADGLSRG